MLLMKATVEPFPFVPATWTTCSSNNMKKTEAQFSSIQRWLWFHILSPKSLFQIRKAESERERALGWGGMKAHTE
jgi:hypothetical protein